MRRCLVCAEEKPLSEFYRDSHDPKGKSKSCKLCRHNWDLVKHGRGQRRLGARRTSPYVRMAQVLERIEVELMFGRPLEALEIIDSARQKYHLV